MTRQRRGFSLVIVLVLTSAMLFVAVAFTDALLQAARTARLGWQGERATHDADATLLEAIASWNPIDAAALRPGESDTLPVASPPMMIRQLVRSRLSARVFLMESSVEVRDGGVRPSRRSIGRAVRLDWPPLPAAGTLTTSGAVAVGENAAVLGADITPSGWNDECAADVRSTPVVAITAQNATIDASATVAGDGSPVRLLSDSARTLRSEQIEAAIAQLSALATTTTTDSVLSTNTLAAGVPACPLWFGDARRGAPSIPECTRRWPVVVASHAGVVRLTGETPAQGVLVVLGDLRVDPGVTFAGTIIVGGRLTVSVAAGELPVAVFGAVLIRDRLNAGSELSGVSALQSSACAARFALAAVASPHPVLQHGWSERP